MADDENKNENQSPPEGDKPPPPPPKPVENSGGDTGNGGGDSSDIRTIVAEEVRKALSSLPGGTRPQPSPRAADIEAEAKRMVQEAADKLKAEEEHESEHKKLADQAKEAAEKAPKKVRRLTKALWGDDE